MPDFLKLLLCRRWCVHSIDSILSNILSMYGVCVCLPPRLSITSGMIWTHYDWLNKGYSFHMADVVIITGRSGLRIEAMSQLSHNNYPSADWSSSYR